MASICSYPLLKKSCFNDPLKERFIEHSEKKCSCLCTAFSFLGTSFCGFSTSIIFQNILLVSVSFLKTDYCVIMWPLTFPNFFSKNLNVLQIFKIFFISQNRNGTEIVLRGSFGDRFSQNINELDILIRLTLTFRVCQIAITCP